MYGRKRVEVMRDWRKLHNKELYNLYFSLNIIGAIKMGGRGRHSCNIAHGREGKCSHNFDLEARTEETTWKI